MRRPFLALLLGSLVLLGYVIAATDTVTSWSDGVAGASGAVPQHLRTCAPGFDYCKVKVSGCGGCHGDWDAMQYQKKTSGNEPVNTPVVDRMSAEIWLSGDPDKWEYDAGKPYQIDIWIHPWDKEPTRQPGQYSKVAFDLNVSAGKLAVYPGDKNTRLTVKGNYSHSGSHNPNAQICTDQACANRRPYGQTIDNESASAGELTNTYQGSLVAPETMPGGGKAYHFKGVWTAPPKQKPHGVAFQMSAMIPNGDGIDSCVYVMDSSGCNSTKGYSDQDAWDWWTFMIPRKIVCEKGQNQVECNDAVNKFILPPAPPPNTNGTTNVSGPNGTRSPGLGPGAFLVVAAVAFARWRRRRPPTPPFSV